MVDTLDRPTPRFPPDQVPRVTDEVRRAFDRWGVGPSTTIVCGGARGADILAAEEGLARGARVRLCLALPPDEFVERSVAIPGTDWEDRFRALLAKADHATLAEHGGAGAGAAEGDAVFARTNEWIVAEARSLAGGGDRRPHALVVWNGREGDGPGGTADFVHRLGYDRPAASIVVIDPTPRRYEARQAHDGRPRRILALDGGGIRGVLSLEILAGIEQGLRRRHGNDLVLGDWFDYIGGTSTGAIIATGLALGMPVADLVGKYKSLGQKSFSRSFIPRRALYKDRPLRDQLVEVFGPDRTLGDPELRSLLLLVMHNTVTDSVWPLSNCTQARYNRADRNLQAPSDRDRNLDLPLVDLLRASTAAPVYFPPQRIMVGRHEFVFQDGGITPFNNPALLLFLMATLPEYGLQWPVGEDRLLVVSVGTGATPAVHDGLLPREVGFLFNATNLTSVFMNGASVGQDLLCRTLGGCRYGEALDREIGDRLNVTGVSGSNLFSYVRYNAVLSDEELAKPELGFTSEKARKAIRKLDGVKAIPDLQAIGRHVAAKVDVDRHFEGFL
jgi:uncharacterized protein